MAVDKPVDNSFYGVNVDSVAIWNDTLSLIKERVNQHGFERWFLPIKAISMENNLLSIEVPNNFTTEWLESKYKTEINDALSAVLNKQASVNILVSASADIPVVQAEPLQVPRQPEQYDNNVVIGNPLNPKYTFDNFIVGLSNRYAYGACVAVAEAPAKTYNPVFIYGGVGLGKTHLLQAIGNQIRNENPTLKIAYLSSEQFLNEMISALTGRSINEFRNKYRHIDVLLIDDIQFLAGKEAMQEEFFHTFNVLYSANRQIVTTSDRKPQELKIEERLRSRFEMGLIADIGTPDLETRVAILKNKAEKEKITVPDDVAIYIANLVKDDVRALEGCLTRVIAYASITKAKLSIETAKECLKESSIGEREKRVTIEAIKEAVVKFYKLKPSDMITKKRTQPVAFARQVAMYITRELTDMSLPEIGQNFGGRDHSTVIHAYETIQNKKETDLIFFEELNKIMEALKS